MTLWLTLVLAAAPPQPLLDGEWARTVKDRELLVSVSATTLTAQDLTLHGKGSSTRITCTLSKLAVTQQQVSATCTIVVLRAGPDLGAGFVDVPTTSWALGFDGAAGTELSKGAAVMLNLERACSNDVAARRLCLAGSCVTLTSVARPRRRPAGSNTAFEVRPLRCDEDLR